jgi:hypothetical protein
LIVERYCVDRAKDCDRLAKEADTTATREAFLAEARKWRALADNSVPQAGDPSLHL